MKTIVLTKEKNRFFQGLDFLSQSLEAFAVIGFELLLTYAIEYNLYGYNDWRSYAPWQSILHWTLTCIAWGLGGLYVIKECARKSDIDLIKSFRQKSLFQGAKEMSLFQWILLVTGTVLGLISTWIDWGGSKVLREFEHNGTGEKNHFNLYFRCNLTCLLFHSNGTKILCTILWSCYRR